MSNVDLLDIFSNFSFLEIHLFWSNLRQTLHIFNFDPLLVWFPNKYDLNDLVICLS